MIDVELQNGDIATTPSGDFVILTRDQARLQSAKNALGIRRGSFIYDRTLGSELNEITTQTPGAFYAARLAASEALFEHGGAVAVIKTVGDGTHTVELKAGKEKEVTEVRFYGDIQ